MKKTSLFLSAFVLSAGIFTACTNEEMLEMPSANDELQGRAQINLTIGNPAETRFTAGTGFQSGLSTTDEVGAVIVDAGYDAGQWGNVSWTVVDSHVGNNKWTYSPEKGRFTTCGTTAVGQWLFYTKYREAVTKDRSAIKFDFPQIQEAAADLRWLENNNYNLKVSPIINIDGIEGSSMDLEVPMKSVLSYVELKFKFQDDVKKVNKVIVSAQEVAGGNPFAKAYQLNNTKLSAMGALAKTSLESTNAALKVEDLNSDDDLTLADQNLSIQAASAKILEKNIDWNAAITSAQLTSKAGDVYPYLILDCEGNHTNNASTNSGMALVDGEFVSYMLMPMGLYQNITLTVYTDNGAYSKTINTRNAYVENVSAELLPPAAKGTNEIYLRAHTVTNLANIEKYTKQDADKFDVADYDYVYFASTNKVAEDVITKTADLVNYINGVTAAGDYTVNVVSSEAFGGTTEHDDAIIPEHKLVLNAAVMAALEAKEAELDGEVHLNFVGAKVDILGNEDSYLSLHNLTFTSGADVVSGRVDVSEDVVVPAGQKLIVKTNSLVKYNNENSTLATFNNLTIEEGAKVYTYKNAQIRYVINDGTFVVNSGEFDIYTNFVNNANVTVKSELTAAQVINNEGGYITNQGSFEAAVLNNADGATLKNNDDMQLVAVESTGTIINNSYITVKGVANIIDGTVTNNANATIDVNTDGTSATLNIKAGAEVVNSGNIYASLGNNTINNLGTITSKVGARTLITTNSSASEDGANGTKGVTMGTLVLEDPTSDYVNVSTLAQQGYIEYTVAEEGEFVPAADARYNKVVFEKAVSFGKEKGIGNIRYIEAKDKVDFSKVEAAVNVYEITFVGNSVIKSPKGYALTFGYITIEENVTVDVPANNTISIYDLRTPDHVRTVKGIRNDGILFVSGKAYMNMLKAEATGTGKFIAGDGNSTAIVWN